MTRKLQKEIQAAIKANLSNEVAESVGKLFEEKKALEERVKSLEADLEDKEHEAEDKDSEIKELQETLNRHTDLQTRENRLDSRELELAEKGKELRIKDDRMELILTQERNNALINQLQSQENILKHVFGSTVYRKSISTNTSGTDQYGNYVQGKNVHTDETYTEENKPADDGLNQ